METQQQIIILLLEEIFKTNTSGTNNTAFGKNALKANTTGANNIAIGLDSKCVNQTGIKMLQWVQILQK